MEKKFITITDAMELLSLSRPTINRFIYRDEIPNYKVGKRRLFDRDELIEWVKSHRNGPSVSKKKMVTRSKMKGGK
jgi:excisionase family DNA binding protein